MMMITIPRGDIRPIRFQVYDLQTGDLSQVDFTEIYVTLKKTIHDRDYVFQKKLSDGGVEKIDVGDYQFRLVGEDTDSLDFNKSYPFDIELIYENEIKQTEYGKLEITPEVTCRWNEVE